MAKISNPPVGHNFYLIIIIIIFEIDLIHQSCVTIFNCFNSHSQYDRLPTNDGDIVQLNAAWDGPEGGCWMHCGNKRIHAIINM